MRTVLISNMWKSVDIHISPLTFHQFPSGGSSDSPPFARFLLVWLLETTTFLAALRWAPRDSWLPRKLLVHHLVGLLEEDRQEETAGSPLLCFWKNARKPGCSSPPPPHLWVGVKRSTRWPQVRTTWRKTKTHRFYSPQVVGGEVDREQEGSVLSAWRLH